MYIYILLYVVSVISIYLCHRLIVYYLYDNDWKYRDRILFIIVSIIIPVGIASLIIVAFLNICDFFVIRCDWNKRVKW